MIFFFGLLALLTTSPAFSQTSDVLVHLRTLAAVEIPAAVKRLPNRSIDQLLDQDIARTQDLSAVEIFPALPPGIRSALWQEKRQRWVKVNTAELAKLSAFLLDERLLAFGASDLVLLQEQIFSAPDAEKFAVIGFWVAFRWRYGHVNAAWLRLTDSVDKDLMKTLANLQSGQVIEKFWQHLAEAEICLRGMHLEVPPQFGFPAWREEMLGQLFRAQGLLALRMSRLPPERLARQVNPTTLQRLGSFYPRLASAASGWQSFASAQQVLRERGIIYQLADREDADVLKVENHAVFTVERLKTSPLKEALSHLGLHEIAQEHRPTLVVGNKVFLPPVKKNGFSVIPVMSLSELEKIRKPLLTAHQALTEFDFSIDERGRLRSKNGSIALKSLHEQRLHQVFDKVFPGAWAALVDVDRKETIQLAGLCFLPLQQGSEIPLMSADDWQSATAKNIELFNREAKELSAFLGERDGYVLPALQNYYEWFSEQNSLWDLPRRWAGKPTPSPFELRVEGHFKALKTLELHMVKQGVAIKLVEVLRIVERELAAKIGQVAEKVATTAVTVPIVATVSALAAPKLTLIGLPLAAGLVTARQSVQIFVDGSRSEWSLQDIWSASMVSAMLGPLVKVPGVARVLAASAAGVMTYSSLHQLVHEHVGTAIFDGFTAGLAFRWALPKRPRGPAAASDLPPPKNSPNAPSSAFSLERVALQSESNDSSRYLQLIAAAQKKLYSEGTRLALAWEDANLAPAVEETAVLESSSRLAVLEDVEVTIIGKPWVVPKPKRISIGSGDESAQSPLPLKMSPTENIDVTKAIEGTSQGGALPLRIMPKPELPAVVPPIPLRFVNSTTTDPPPPEEDKSAKSEDPAEEEKTRPVTSVDEDVLEKFKQGMLPLSFLETYRIVSPDLPVTKNLEKYVNMILQNLFREQNFTAKPVRVLLSADDEVIAFTITLAEPPVIALSKKFLLEVANMDGLAMVLAHEYTHILLKEKYGGELKNSKGEELAADLRALEAVVNANYNPEAALAEMRRFFRFDKPSWLDIGDVHPTDENRIRALEAHLTVLRRQRGRFVESTIQQPPALRQAISDATHTSYFQHRAVQTGWNERTVAEKLGILALWFEQVDHWNRVRIDDMKKFLRSLSCNRSRIDERQSMDRVADLLLDQMVKEAQKFSGERLIERVKHLTSFYDLLAGSVESWEKVSQYRSSLPALTTHPLGRLLPIDRAVVDFVRAKNRAQAVAAARLLKNLVEQEKVPGLVLQQFIDWYKFPRVDENELQRRGKVLVSWQQFFVWATEGVETQMDIMHALLLLGILDTRVMAFLSPEEAKTFRDFRASFHVRTNPQANPFGITRIIKIHDEVIGRYTISANGELTLHSRKVDVHDDLNLTVVTGDRISHENLLQTLDSLIEKFLAAPETGEKPLRDFLAKSTERIEKGRYTVHQRIMGESAREKYPDLFVAANLHAHQLTANVEAALARCMEMLVQRKTPRDLAVLRFFYLREKPANENLFLRHSVDDVTRSDIYELKVDNRLGYALHRFLFRYWSNFLSPKELRQALFLLQMTRFDVGYGQTPVDGETYTSVVEFDKFLQEMRRLLHYAPPENIKAAMVRMAKFDEQEPFLKDLAQAEALLLLLKTPPNHWGDFDLVSFLELIGQTRLSIEIKIIDLIKEYLQRHYQWPREAQEAAKVWSLLNRFNLFPRDHIYYADKLDVTIKLIRQVRSPEVRVKLWQTLMHGPRVREPEMRQLISERLIAGLARQLGADDGSGEFFSRASTVVTDLYDLCSPADRPVILNDLAQAILSQEKVSAFIQTKLSAITKEQLEGSQLQGIVAEGIIEAIRSSRETRQAFLELLLSNAENEKADAFAVWVRDVLLLKEEGDLQEFARFHEEEFLRYAGSQGIILWRNFWSSPLPVRAGMMELLLFPSVRSDERDYLDVFRYVVGKLFNPEETYAAEAGKILRAYYLARRPYERRLFLAAALVAVEKNMGRRRTVSLGSRLATVLELLDPAAVKLGQAIHSHPATPEDVRSGMERLKSLADVPTRWELFELYQKHVPAEERQDIARVKEVLGAASYYIAVAVELKDGSEDVLVILRDNALRRSEAGFATLRETARILRHEETFGEDFLRILDEMLSSAASRAKIETSSAIAKEQSEIAATLYHGAVINVGDTKIHLSVARVKSFGDHYRRLSRAAGKHFNDLPERKPEQLAFKKKIAQGYFAYELMLILQGGVFDVDRHGAQMRVSGDQVVLFDHGGLMRREVTAEDRRDLANFLVRAMVQYGQGKGFDGVLPTMINEKISRHENADYLLSLQQALLALQDFYKPKYIAHNDMVAILKAVYDAGIHPDVAAEVTRQILALGELSALQRLSAQARQSAVEINIEKAH